MDSPADQDGPLLKHHQYQDNIGDCMSVMGVSHQLGYVARCTLVYKRNSPDSSEHRVRFWHIDSFDSALDRRRCIHRSIGDGRGDIPASAMPAPPSQRDL